MANDAPGSGNAISPSEERYRALFDSIDEGFCLLEVMFDARGRAVDLLVLEVNPSFEKQTGILNMRGKRAREIIPQLEEHWFETYGRIVQTGEPARFESEAAPIHRWFDVFAFRFGGPEERQVAVVFNDITGRKRAQEALRVSEERFRSYFELGLIGMAITSPAKGCLEVNDELCRILGYERSELLQMTWAEVTHPEDLAADVAQFTRVIAGEIEGYTLDKRWICKQGRVIDSIMAAKCLRRADGSVDYFVGLVLDTTERKRTEAALRKTQEELAHVMRITTVGELAASIAHEMNQPLGAIVNNSNVCLRLLAERFAPDADGRGALQDLVRDAERASAIIARVREMTARTLPQRASLQLRDVIAEVLALAHHQLAAHRIETLTDLPEDLPRVSGDRVELQQVFLNLIINALDAMSTVEDDRRVLTIRGRRDELHGQPAVRITVRDRGHGVAPVDRPHLFEAFYTTKPQGMGMGLRIGASIVEGLGGRLSFAPNESFGVTFSCLLPAEVSRSS